MSNRVNNLIRYTGHKYYELKNIIDLLPDKSKYNKIIEPFAGCFGFSYYLYNKLDIKDKSYIFNDINIFLYLFFNDVINNKLEEYINYYNDNIEDIYKNHERWLNICKINREFRKLKLKDDILNYYNKYKYDIYIYNRLSVRGAVLIGYDIKTTQVNRRGLTEMKKLDIKTYNKFIDLLSKSIYLNNDYKDILNKYKDDEDALVFFDPPYLSSDNSSYYLLNQDENKNIIDNTEIFINILDFLKNSKCKCILIINDNAINRYIYKDYIKGVYNKTYALTKRKTKHLIITNY